MPKVSVIIPVYNSEKYLEKCLESVLNQTLTDIEIVTVDDGSHDSSARMLDDYAVKYPDKFVVTHKENGGQGIARNIGIEMASGEYISFLDSDDYYEPARLEKLYEAATKNNADFVGCGYTEAEISDSDEIVHQRYISNKPCTDNHKMLVSRALVNPLLNFYKRDLLINNNVRFTEGYIYEDTAFWAKAVPYIQKAVYLSESLATHTIHSNSTMTIIKADRVRNIFPVLSDLLGFYKSQGVYEEYRNEIDYFCSRILLCSSVDRISLVPSNKERKKLIGETYSFLNKEIPNYKQNPILAHGKINWYISHGNPRITGILVLFLRAKAQIKKKSY